MNTSNSTSVPTPNTLPSSEERKKGEAASKTKSKSIPITNHIHRTESEIRLYEDEALAEHRDNCMFNRIVSGLSRRQEETAVNGQGSLDFLHESGECINNIMRTRQQHPDDCESLHSRNERSWKTIGGQSTGAPPRPKTANDTEQYIAEWSGYLGQTFLHSQDDDDQVFIMDP